MAVRAHLKIPRKLCRTLTPGGLGDGVGAPAGRNLSLWLGTATEASSDLMPPSAMGKTAYEIVSISSRAIKRTGHQQNNHPWRAV